MSITDILYNIVVMPIQIFYEIVFNTVYEKITNDYGLTIIILSLVVNVLILPLYKRADAIQAEERDIEAKLKKGVNHIKKSFKGNEQTMILHKYYSQNNYKPYYVVKGLLPLLLQIPFFIAAYNFLSNHSGLIGTAFGPLKDLGLPDGMLILFGTTINVLPVIMTIINIISSYIYTRGFPLKNKIQLYGMALIFLFLLYDKPSGLVLYWTLNNVFSLVKNIISKIKKKGGNYKHEKRKQVLTRKSNHKQFVFGCVFLAILIGIVVPLSVITASPQEFIVLNMLENPLMYLLSSFSMAVGMFVFWLGVFYILTSKKYRYIFENVIIIICIACVVNFYFFGTNLGLINTSLKYDNEISYSISEILINTGIIIMIAFIVTGLFLKTKKLLTNIVLIGTITLLIISGVGIFTIQQSINDINFEELHKNSTGVTFEFSNKGKNVIVIMMDRAMSAYIPYIFEEKPELKDKFSGFVYYPNTISFGSFTNIATPAIFGGYEYTPYELNLRDSESLKDKHNEALKVMPDLFYKNGYKVTVSDLPYADYKIASDLSIFDEYEGINKYLTREQLSSYPKRNVINNNMRNFYCYGIFKTLPILLQELMYDNGLYNSRNINNSTSQIIANNSEAIGNNVEFLLNYEALKNLQNITKVNDSDDNTLLLFQNSTTHEETLLQKPNYTPMTIVDNTKYDKECYNKYIIDGNKLNLNNKIQISHYHVNMLSLMTLGQWFDYLKKQGVYDNTRIIIVSDHGRDVKTFDDNIITYENDKTYDLTYFQPLLMVKDFNAKEFKVSHEFMTNADVPTLATKGLIDNPINPFTNKPITGKEKYGDLYAFGSEKWNPETNNGNTFEPIGIWFKHKAGSSKVNSSGWEYVVSDKTMPIKD